MAPGPGGRLGFVAAVVAAVVAAALFWGSVFFGVRLQKCDSYHTFEGGGLKSVIVLSLFKG